MKSLCMLFRACGAMKTTHCLLLATMFSINRLILAHVKLTFPPARSYALDFLDSRWTVPPCGMPKGLPASPVTTLIAGSTINVTWHIAYPNRGGFKIELRNSNSDLLETLYSSRDQVTASPDYTVLHSVTLPTTECRHCMLRLLRDAEEWNSTQWSCADVEIVSVPTDDACSGRGSYDTAAGCVCNSLSSGKYCENRDECWQDTHCGVHGKCIDTQSSSYPKLKCFCEAGWFGLDCNKESPVKDINHCLHTHRMLTDDSNLYWRILGSSEIEIILHVTGSSWAAIGWRPDDADGGITSSCRSFPSLPGYPSTHRDTGGGVGEHAARLHAMDCTDMVVAQVRGSYSRVRDSYTRDISSPREDAFYGGTDSLTAALAMETLVDGKPTTWLLFRRNLTATEPSDHSFTNKTMHVIWAKGQPSELNCHLGTQVPSNSSFYVADDLKYHGCDLKQRGRLKINFIVDESGPCFGSYWHPFDCSVRDRTCDYYASWQYSQLEDDVQFTLKVKDLGSKWTGIGFSHDRQMNESDAVIARMAEKGYYSITDRHIIDKSVNIDPRQNIYNISASPSGNITTFTFARKRITEDPNFDLLFSDEGFYMFFPYSGGSVNETSGELSRHFLIPAISFDRICIGPCAVRRNATPPPYQTRTHATEMCEGNIYFPAGCSRSEMGCEYTMTWIYNSSKDDIMFKITTTHANNKWTGVGFSEDMYMANSDAIIGYTYVDGERLFNITNRWIVDANDSPAIDPDQSTIYNLSGNYVNGSLTLQFTRKLNTNQSTDLQFGNGRCYYVFIPFMGGKFYPPSGKLKQHVKKPVITGKQVCFTTCPGSTTPAPTTLPMTTKESVPSTEVTLTTIDNNISTSAIPTTEHSYNVSFAMDMQWHGSLTNSNTTEYQKLADDVQTALNNTLQEVDGYQDATVIGFDQGSVIANTQVIAVGADGSVTLLAIENTLNDSINSGQMGDLNVLPGSLSVRINVPTTTVIVPSTTTEQDISASPLKGDKTWIYTISSAAVFVVLVMASIAGFVIWRKEKRARQMDQKPETAADDWGTGATTNPGHSRYSSVRGRRDIDQMAYDMFTLRPRPFTEASWMTEWTELQSTRISMSNGSRSHNSELNRRHSRSSTVWGTGSSIGLDTEDHLDGFDSESPGGGVPVSATTAADVHHSGHPTTVESLDYF
ncbi:PREDICTED: uncharacterized protein LOC106808604 isoform X2 [Priapulus caudatus]|uniref:Uncharacterized protein LOC106808604 isoform X2 n=1 Tax=Priapulus caudatus TaxID=37621 RepID=A0ABM1E3U5_PRICU|nr:PREDICTED: uncharacterized protein LOC106808604 isoform X2 [Priapulus caudatus]